MAIGRTPAGAGDFVREVGTDFAGFIARDHGDIEAAGDSTVGETLEDFLVFLGLAKTQVAALMILAVIVEFLRERRPEGLDAPHGNGEFPWVTAGLADTAAVAGGAAVADEGASLEDSDIALTGFGQIIGGCTADDAAADNDDIGCLIHCSCLRSFHGIASPSLWGAWGHGLWRSQCHRGRRRVLVQGCP